MGYDPQACGARCDVCVLRDMREGEPVGPEQRSGRFAVVGEAPGEHDVLAGRPLAGPAGQELARAFDTASVFRHDASYHHALACAPSEGKLRQVRARLAKVNRARKADKLPSLPDPVVACRPRLFAELADKEHIVALGKTAFVALMPEHVDDKGRPRKHPSIDRIGGNMYDTALHDGVVRKMVPVTHPRRVLHQPRWREAFQRGVSRAVRWFRGELVWQEPVVLYDPPLEWLWGTWLPWVKGLDAVWADCETDALEPWRANMRSLQIGTPDHVTVLTVRSIHGHPLHDAATRRAYVDLVRAIVDANVPTVGHNWGWYDRAAVAAWTHAETGQAVDWAPDTDTILLHRSVHPEMPHGLDHVGSFYTDVHAWKADRPSENARTDTALWRYGALDTCVTARVTSPLLTRHHRRLLETQRVTGGMKPVGFNPIRLPWGPATRLVHDDPVLVHDHQMQTFCWDLHRIGIHVDQDRRVWAHGLLMAEEAKWIHKLQDLIGNHTALDHGWDGAGRPNFNPRSVRDMQRLLFDAWDLPPPGHLPASAIYTDSDERSVGDAVLRAYLADITLSREQHQILHACRRAKKMRTFYGRFLTKLVPYDQRGMPLWEDDEAEAEAEAEAVDWLAVWEDGRLRVNWNAHVTGVGRLSSGGRPSRINLQTIPAFLRHIFTPAPGHVYVGADLASIHLVIIANLWGIPSLVDDYTHVDPATGQPSPRDPHATLARLIFGDRFEQASGYKGRGGYTDWKGDAKRMRQIAKALRYAGAYKAEVPTIHATMTRAEDDEGNLTMRSLTVTQVRHFYETWMGKEPEWEQAWNREIAMFREHGFLLSPIMGRRADFTDGEDPNKLVNYRILSGEADVMGPMSLRVHARIPPGCWSPTTGVVGQFHDALVVEVPADRAAEAQRVLDEEMYAEVRGWRVPIRTDGAAVGTSWKEVG